MIDLKQLRKDQKITQVKLGELLSCTQNFICQYEVFRRPIPQDVYNKCVELFGKETVRKYIIKDKNNVIEIIGYPKKNREINRINELRKEIVKLNLNVPILKDADFAILNTDDCMQPRVMSNDYILLKKMNNELPIFGNIYFIRTDDLRSLRYVKKGTTDDNYLLIAENKHYEDLIINKNEIIEMFLMVGRIG